MRAWALLVVAAAASASCGGVSRRELPTVLVQAVARTTCADGGSDCEGPGWPAIREPHCGYSFGSLEEPGMVTVLVGVPASGVRGLVQVETGVESGDDGVVQLASRRLVVIEAQRTRVYSVFTSEPLYDLDPLGGMSPVPRDAGESAVGDGGAFDFRYPALSEDGGALQTVELHRVMVAQQRDAEIHDSSGDPFAGCCAQVGWETPALLPLALLGRLVFRRRRHP